MRKIVSVIIALTFAFSLVGCADGAYEPVSAPDSGVVSSDETASANVETQETTAVATTEETTVSETTVPETTVTSAETTTAPVTTTIPATTEEVTTTTEATLPSFSVEETSLTMYASNSVNVRSGPSTDYDRIGHLDANDEVTVTGIASTGWYQIEYNGTVGYVSNNYLSDEKTAVTTSASSSSSSSSTSSSKTSSSLRDALNSITLSPTETGFDEIDEYIDDLLSTITTSDMDTYDKIKACYDYLIDYMTYGQQEDFFWYWLYYGGYGGGYLALLEGVGVCDDYSAAFCMLTNKIGVPMTVVTGQTHMASGGFTGHAWCELDMGNGTVYIFDPQIEDSIAGRQDGKVSYLRFGKTTEELADKYIKY